MSKNSTVLIAEDDDDILELLVEVIRSWDYETLGAKNGSEALELVKKGGIDFVLADIQMPGLTGLELLKGVKKFAPNISVILMTGHTAITHEEAVKLGATMLISKPINFEALETILASGEHRSFSKFEPPQNKKMTIWVVEDEKPDQLILSRCIAELDPQNTIDLVMFNNGKEVLDAIRTIPEPDLVITDLKMPLINGYILLDKLKIDGRFRRVPKIVLTSSHRSEDKRKALTMGANAFHFKPENLVQWRHLARSITHFWLPWARR
jgi:CheY-like chemotaxis protein